MKKNKRIIFILPLIAIAVVVAALTVFEQKGDVYQRDNGMVFGTTYSITYQSDTNLKKEIEDVLKGVDTSLSMFNEHSTISLVNNNKLTDISDSNFIRILDLAFEINKETEGAFDITVAPLVNAWGFGFKNGEMPDSKQVDSLRSIIGMHKLSVTPTDKGIHIAKSDPRIMLDCSAIAKGYGVEVVAELLRSKGISNFMVEIGGEVVTSGISPKRLPWKIGVIKPSDDSLNVSNELQTCLNITDKAMATSGNYRNFYYKGGKKYAHTIDPKTGYPIQHNILSSTVITNDCAVADAYATAFMVLGFEKAKTVLDRHPELHAYFILAGNGDSTSVWFSPSLRDKIE